MREQSTCIDPGRMGVCSPQQVRTAVVNVNLLMIGPKWNQPVPSTVESHEPDIEHTPQANGHDALDRSLVQ